MTGEAGTGRSRIVRRLIELGVVAACLGAAGWYGWRWWSNRGAELNISCFAYRDVNRNGIYDMADRPYAGLRIALLRPRGDVVATDSNISGFTNFPMSARKRSAPINAPGAYRIEVRPPAGWVVTSHNQTQAFSFKPLAGSPAGLVAEQTLIPVGVAPELTISGHLAADRGPASIRALSPAGELSYPTVEPSGAFSFPASAGDWQLTFTQGGDIAERRVRVRDYAVVLSRPVPGAPPARATPHVVDFDTLTPSDTLYEIPRGYGGLDWYNWVATHQKMYKSEGMINGTVSSEYFAYNSSGHPATISMAQPFDLAGVHVGVAWPQAERFDVEINAWRGAELAYTDRLRAKVAGPMYFDADYRGITRIEMRSLGYWQVVLDDLEYRTDAPAPAVSTPTPAAAAGAGTGAAAR